MKRDTKSEMSYESNFSTTVSEEQRPDNATVLDVISQLIQLEVLTRGEQSPLGKKQIASLSAALEEVLPSMDTRQQVLCELIMQTLRKARKNEEEDASSWKELANMYHLERDAWKSLATMQRQEIDALEDILADLHSRVELLSNNSDSKTPRPEDQPLPSGGVEDVGLGVVEWMKKREYPVRLQEAMLYRRQLGIARYGQSLHTFDGRNCPLDLIEELQDATVYCYKVAREGIATPEELADIQAWMRVLLEMNLYLNAHPRKTKEG